jgi:nitroreductase
MKKSPFKDLAKKADDIGKQLERKIEDSKATQKTKTNPENKVKQLLSDMNINKIFPNINKHNPLDENQYNNSEIDTILHNIFTRKCIRHYLNKDVPDSYIIKIIDAARQAPSAGNYQPWEFIIVRNSQAKQDIIDGCFRDTRQGNSVPGMEDKEDWLMEAPVVIIVTINQRLARGVYGERGEKLYGIQSTAAAIENMLLAANAYGLGSSWVGGFSEEHISAVIACPKYMRPCAIVAIGWPAEKPKKPQRHPIEDFIHIEKFGRTPREKLVRPREQLF